ncbi:hypothetical protein ACIOMM_03495 [Streptomyces sp. NPDC087908]|uniref:hypothetical protein n=1 Tax=Streptomyces sp. NPDC087908 TaxID=3365820 RepID=UPI0037F49CEC
MTASENSGAAILCLGSYAERGRVGSVRRAAHAAPAGEEPADGTETMGTLLHFPLPRTETVPAAAPEETPAAPPRTGSAGTGSLRAIRPTETVRPTGTVRPPETMRTGAAVGAAAAVAVVYALGRRSGRRDRGSVARFLDRPF